MSLTSTSYAVFTLTWSELVSRLYISFTCKLAYIILFTLCQSSNNVERREEYIKMICEIGKIMCKLSNLLAHASELTTNDDMELDRTNVSM